MKEEELVNYQPFLIEILSKIQQNRPWNFIGKLEFLNFYRLLQRTL